jgi:hypothetical protein
MHPPTELIMLQRIHTGNKRTFGHSSSTIRPFSRSGYNRPAAQSDSLRVSLFLLSISLASRISLLALLTLLLSLSLPGPLPLSIFHYAERDCYRRYWTTVPAPSNGTPRIT